MADRFELHQSVLSLLSKCGMMAYYRYVEGRKMPPGTAMLRGTAAHAGIEADLRAKMERGALLSAEEVRSVTSDKLDASWLGEEPALDDEEAARGAATVKAETKDHAIACAVAHHEELAPVIDPIAVEQRWKLECPGFPFDLGGTIDVVEHAPEFDGERPAERVRDTKTSAKAVPMESARRSVQLDLYTFVRRSSGRRVEEVALDVVQIGKAGKATAYNLIAPAPPPDHAALLRRLETAARVFQTGAFYPVDPTGPGAWVCSAKFCGYYNDVCPYGRRAMVQG